MDLSGKVFERLKVLHRDLEKEKAYWWCKCSCGNTKSVAQSHLNNGSIRSCGCLRKETTRKTATKHGLRHIPEYQSYRAMLDRCNHPYYPGYENYGGRGITVCDRWLDPEKGIFNFIEDLGPRPSLKHTLDRIDNDKNYSPENCRWVDRKTQLRNRRPLKNKSSKYKGVSSMQGSELWRSRFSNDGVEKSLGCFENEIDAALAWDEEARKNNYEESWLNFPKKEVWK